MNDKLKFVESWNKTRKICLDTCPFCGGNLKDKLQKDFSSIILNKIASRIGYSTEDMHLCIKIANGVAYFYFRIQDMINRNYIELGNAYPVIEIESLKPSIPFDVADDFIKELKTVL